MSEAERGGEGRGDMEGGTERRRTSCKEERKKRETMTIYIWTSLSLFSLLLSIVEQTEREDLCRHFYFNYLFILPFLTKYCPDYYEKEKIGLSRVYFTMHPKVVFPSV